MEFDRRKETKYDNDVGYIERLKEDIRENGLQQPLVLAVSKKTQLAYLCEGNHRFVCLEMLNVHWVPLQVGYWFLNDDNDHRFNFIPAALHEFPNDITPSMCGFETRTI